MFRTLRMRVYDAQVEMCMAGSIHKVKLKLLKRFFKKETMMF